MPVVFNLQDKENTLNKERVEGNWMQVKGTLLEKWGKLTSDDLDVIEGRREQLSGKIQERYGIAKEAAEAQVAAFWDSLKK